MIEILEQYVRGKKDDSALCEDILVIRDDFVAAIDGATAKSSLDWNGKASGRHAAEVLAHVFKNIPANSTATEATAACTQALAQSFVDLGHTAYLADHPGATPLAKFVAVSLARREVWRVGDGGALINGKAICGGANAHNTASATARAVILEQCLLQGQTVEQMKATDPGRAFIMPLLLGESSFVNQPDCAEFWFAAINGQPVPEAGIEIFPIPETPAEIVLASDGLPFLYPTLKESLDALTTALVEDPLCIKKLRTTKCPAPGQWSFDDVSYLRVSL